MNGPFYRCLLLLVCLLPAWGLCLPALCAGDETATGLLVLRNGNVIDGKVTRLADHFRVQLEHGQLQVRVDQVEMFCLTLDEAYERRREMRIGSTADSHLELAKWCLRHDLLEYAARELLEARSIDPHHRKLLLLDRQLNQAMRQQAKVPKLPPLEKVEPKAIEVDLTSLEQAPQWARALFVRKVQPMLVKSCTTAGCHQSGSANQWQLNRLAVLGAGHPQATKTNLASVLKQIDFQNASQSPILQLAGAAHGPAPSTPLQAHQMQLLRAWIEQMAMPTTQTGEAETDERAALKQASFITVGPSSVARLGESYLHAQDISKLRSKLQQTGHADSDPFNPEVFNRLYSSRKGKQNTKPLSPPKSSPLPESRLLPED